MTYRIEITETALASLRGISDVRTRDAIIRRIDALDEGPEEQGKPLLGELRGLLSVRAAGQRYRIVFRVHESKLQVLVLFVGIRREGSRQDVYALARRLIERGMI